jgi:hypothetical protein
MNLEWNDPQVRDGDAARTVTADVATNDNSPPITATLRDAGWFGNRLAGDIYGDTRDRWRDGTPIHTSNVTRELPGEVFVTRNSVYKVESWNEYGKRNKPASLPVAGSAPRSKQPKVDVREWVASLPWQPVERQFNFYDHLVRQREFSERTFGPGVRTKGVVAHIRKELAEIEKDPLDVEEWIDVVILALDGAWRAGGSPGQIISTLVGKQTKNEGRAWPDWRTAGQDSPIEHDRTNDNSPAKEAA